MTSHPRQVTFVCSGNICRSVMGQVILEQLVAEAGLAADVQVSSSGIGDWHVGRPADPRTVAVLAQHGYDGSPHRARQFDPEEFDGLDLVLASDEGHVSALHELAGTPENRAKIKRTREFDPAAAEAGTLDTADPWFGGDDDFARCFDEVEAACHGILEHLREQV